MHKRRRWAAARRETIAADPLLKPMLHHCDAAVQFYRTKPDAPASEAPRPPQTINARPGAPPAEDKSLALPRFQHHFDYCRAAKAGRRAATVRLGDYTLNLSFTGRGRVPIAPEAARPAQQTVPAPPAPPGPAGTAAPMEAAAILVASGPDEFYMGGSGLRISFTPNTPCSVFRAIFQFCTAMPFW